VSAARLDGRRVAVTRGRAGEDALSARLRELGADVVEFPSIATAPPDAWEDLDRALRDLARFDWIAFASATAVDMALGRLETLGLERPPAVRLAAVGKATAERLRRRWRAPDLVPEEARGEALASALAADVRGRRVLVPRAAEGRPELVEGLAAAGAEVVAPVCYRTLPASPASLAPLGEALARGELDAVAFASPSAVRSVVSALGPGAGLLGRCALAAIGPTTAAALREAGLAPAVVPSEATGRHLAEAIAARLGPRP
jgi:uroporphyrinogen-III synthase/uroporphyrinogen III methyltransferase/synthase